MSQREDPFRNTRFILEWEGIQHAGFSEVTIPDATVEPVDYREGTDPTLDTRKLPGLIKHSNITLKRGVTTSTELADWFKEVQSGKGIAARKNVSIILQDEEGNDKLRWEFVNCWPTKYDAPDLNATGNEIAVETLELTHEGLARKK